MASVKLAVLVSSVMLLALIAGCVNTPASTANVSSGTPTASTNETGTPVTTTANATTVSHAGAENVTVDLNAKDIKFDTSTITVPAGAYVTIVFHNEDAGIPHNFALYTDSSASTSLFVGDRIIGDSTTNYTFYAPSTPGTYFFRCDVHPTLMTGTFVVQ